MWNESLRKSVARCLFNLCMTQRKVCGSHKLAHSYVSSHKSFQLRQILAYEVKWTITILPYNEITIKLRNNYRYFNEIYYCRNLIRVSGKVVKLWQLRRVLNLTINKFPMLAHEIWFQKLTSLIYIKKSFHYFKLTIFN